jgi:hypothetical protein
MADYKLVLDGLAAFVVDLASTSGDRSMRRFPTEAAALAWIAEQEAHDAATEPVKGANGNQSSTLLRDRSREADSWFPRFRPNNKGQADGP